MKIRNILALILALSLCLVCLTACGGSKSEKPAFEDPVTEYDGKVLSYSAPEGSNIQAYDDGYSIVSMYPSDEFQMNTRSTNKVGKDSFETEEELAYQVEEICSNPINYVSVTEDARPTLESYFENKMADAESAARYVYRDYLNIGYTKSSNVGTAGASGIIEDEIDGKTAHVVWHAESDEALSWQTMYECFIDAPGGGITEIDYMIADQATTDAVDSVLNSVSFK
jgi:hypothetical protein